MALTKPSVLPVWAEAGDKVQPTNPEVQTGWPVSNTPPARQRFNWILNFLMNGVRYFTRRGMPDYGADETYMIGDRCIGDDGKTYRSIQDNNTNHTPSSSPLWWERWGYTATELTDALNSNTPSIIVRAASTAAINLASPGANIDGVAMVAGDLFLEKDNATGASRGIYVWNGAAVPATRATQADTAAELRSGVTIQVREGTANADSVWMLTTDGAITIGVTALTFAQTSGVFGFAKLAATQAFTGQNNGTVYDYGNWTGGGDVFLQSRNNFQLTLTGNGTFNNPSVMPAVGTSGMITVIQDATGGRTLAYGSFFKFVGGTPTLSTAANATDAFAYYVLSSTKILLVHLKGIA